MTVQELDLWLVSTLDDHRLSRSERQTLSAGVTELGPGVDREWLRHRAFEIARNAMNSPTDLAVLDWLEDVAKTIREEGAADTKLVASQAYFSPGDECLNAIDQLLHRARKTAEICVFTITDDRLADAILDCHRRKVSVRIITDDSKAQDLGSDVEKFEHAGILLQVDRSPFHMHHKFAIVDGETLLTGSYNWTRGAARDNEENLIITSEARLVSAFREQFEAIWAKLMSP